MYIFKCLPVCFPLNWHQPAQIVCCSSASYSSEQKWRSTDSVEQLQSSSSSQVPSEWPEIRHHIWQILGTLHKKACLLTRPPKICIWLLIHKEKSLKNIITRHQLVKKNLFNKSNFYYNLFLKLGRNFVNFLDLSCLKNSEKIHCTTVQRTEPTSDLGFSLFPRPIDDTRDQKSYLLKVQSLPLGIMSLPKQLTSFLYFFVIIVVLHVMQWRPDVLWNLSEWPQAQCN